LKIDNLPIEVYNRYAADDYIRRHNPLVEFLRQANNRPSTLPTNSITSHSHLCSISLDKGLFCPSADFSPPGNASAPDYIFSSLYYTVLENAQKRYEEWKGSPNTSLALSGRTEIVLQDFFSTINYLHAIFRLIQSQRSGIRQG
jgi:hypothetical protein